MNLCFEFAAELTVMFSLFFFLSPALYLRFMGAPASGKGTQCELLSENFGLTHISAGDLLRAEVASGTANGKKAKEFMDAGKLVPNEIVVTMVKDRLSQSDAQAGWLLDGYPRSKDQADALEEADIRPEVFLLLEVPEELLVERVVGRRLDPETGKIYHLKYAPPESDEIAARLIQRSDDTEEKVKLAAYYSAVSSRDLTDVLTFQSSCLGRSSSRNAQ